MATEKKAGNRNLTAAKVAKNDEFYTRAEDVNAELQHYRPQFAGKTVYCNCDGPQSEFWKWFHLRFHELGLKRLIATCYTPGGRGKRYDYYEGVETGLSQAQLGQIDDEVAKGGNRAWCVDVRSDAAVESELEGDGGFQTPECVAILNDEADVVCTNPPFSLFREFMGILMGSGKGFLVVGNNNAVTYKEIFPMIRDGRLWLGWKASGAMAFRLPDSAETWDEAESKRIGDGHKYQKLGCISWFTDMEVGRRVHPLDLIRRYDEATLDDSFENSGVKAPYVEAGELYPFYDNYPAINVNSIRFIPADCDAIEARIPEGRWEEFKVAYGKDFEDLGGGKARIARPVMGVPITFLKDHCPDQFEIVGFRKNAEGEDLKYADGERDLPLLPSFDPHKRETCGLINGEKCSIGGRQTYCRILIRKVGAGEGE